MAFDLGFDRAGLKCAWQCEVDPYCRSVLKRHWPDVARYDDVTDLRHPPAVDIVVGGFPCQDLSIAGKRAGLSGLRSGLFWEMLRVIKEVQPSLVVWENVPNLLASDGGRDIRRVCSALAEHGYFGCVRTLDAQNFGVPQRRRRLFGVFARGRSGAERACQILSLTEGVSGDFAPGPTARENIAACFTAGTSSRGISRPGRRREDDSNLVPDSIGTLMSDISHPGRATLQSACASQVIPAVAGTCGGDARRGWSDDTDRATFIPMAFDGATITSPGNKTRVERGLPCNTLHGDARMSVVAKTIMTGEGRRQDHETCTLMPHLHGVRRLTPRECERCQGFPDDFTRWGHDDKEMSDSRRYAMIGNSVVPAIAEWIGERIIG